MTSAGALGVGVIYVPGLEPLLSSPSTRVDVVEIEPQTLWRHDGSGRQRPRLPPETLQWLSGLSQHKVIHSVGCALGGTKAPDPGDVRALNDLVRALEAPWLSEHLAFSEVAASDQHFHAGFLLPPLQTDEGVRVAAEQIRRFSGQLPVPLLVETGTNYLRPRPREMPDGEFVARVVEQAGCHLLLDLHNVWANARNGRQAVQAFLDSIDLGSVWELHLAGGTELDGYWLDAHSGAVPEPVLELAAELVPRLPNLKAVTFEIFSSFVPLVGLEVIEAQLDLLAGLWDRRSVHGAAHLDPAAGRVVDTGVTPGHSAMESATRAAARWESELGLAVLGSGSGSGVEADPGVALVQKLVGRFRAGAITKAHGAVVKLLVLALGTERLEELLAGYLRATRPKRLPLEEAQQFACFVQQHAPEVPYLSELIAYEQAQAAADITGRLQHVHFEHHPGVVLGALSNGHLPDSPPSGRYVLEVTPMG